MGHSQVLGYYTMEGRLCQPLFLPNL